MFILWHMTAANEREPCFYGTLLHVHPALVALVTLMR